MTNSVSEKLTEASERTAVSGESGYPSRISLSTSIKGKTSLGGENKQGYGSKQRI